MPAPTARPEAEERLSEADLLHRRAVEVREFRRGRAMAPAGFESRTTRTTATGTIAVTYPVMGMTCRSCEVRIHRHVSRLPHVQAVTASAVRGQVTVESTEPVSPAAIEAAIRKAGYEIGRTPWLERDPRVWATFAAGLGLVALLALLVSLTGLEDLAAGAGDLASGGLVVALLLGLAAGVSTCMALVGGLVLGLSASFNASRPASTSAAAAMRPGVVFVFGRIAGYAVFGAALGAVGASVAMPPQLTAVLMILVAIVMTILGTRLTGISPRVAGWSPTLPMGLGVRLGLTGGDGAPTAYSDTRAATLGALSFFLPCGFTQAIQVFALSTGSPVFGAALLATFAIGTAPGLLGVAGLPMVVPARHKPTLLRLVGVVVLAFAFVNGTAGLRLSGFSLPALVGVANAAPLPGVLGPDGVQRITTYQVVDGYSPANIAVYAGYPIEWTVQSETTASCAASLWAPGVGIRARLAEGPNIFELPALPEGVLNYTCSMGMYGGRITVVAPPADLDAQLSTASPSPDLVAAAPASPSGTPAPSDDVIGRPFDNGSGTGDAATPVPAPVVTPAPVATPTAVVTPAPVPAGDAASPGAPAAPNAQELFTYQEEGGYGPADARIKAGIPTTWHIDSRAQASCAAYVYVPSLGIEKVLEPGDNVIDLPALEAGTLDYTCGMGMFWASIAIEP